MNDKPVYRYWCPRCEDYREADVLYVDAVLDAIAPNNTLSPRPCSVCRARCEVRKLEAVSTLWGPVITEEPKP